MIDNILSIDQLKNQLVVTGLQLVHKVFGLIECSPELINNSHAVKANELSKQWNQKYIDLIVAMENAREGK